MRIGAARSPATYLCALTLTNLGDVCMARYTAPLLGISARRPVVSPSIMAEPVTSSER
jgi:hypothetical protein